MSKFKAKLAEIEADIIAKLHKKLNKFNEIKANTVADLLTILAFIIIFGTTFVLNVYIGAYVLAIELLITSYFVARR